MTKTSRTNATNPKYCRGCHDIPEKLSRQALNHWIAQVGYEILDDIVAPACSIEGIMADLDLADIDTYTDSEPEADKIIEAIAKKYKMDDMDMRGVDSDTPISFIALQVLLHGQYKKGLRK